MADITVLGRLTRDPEKRNAGNGTVVAVDIAESYKDRQGNEITNYYRASFWNHQGDVVMQYFHKGSPIFVGGELQPRPYQSNNGNSGLSLDINHPHFSFVPAPPRNQNNGGYNQPARPLQPSQVPNTGYRNNQQNNQPNGGQQYQQGQLNTTQGNGWENTGAGQKLNQMNRQNNGYPQNAQNGPQSNSGNQQGNYPNQGGNAHTEQQGQPDNDNMPF